jgi:hypothetical protein
MAHPEGQYLSGRVQHFKEEQIKKGVKFSAKVLSRPSTSDRGNHRWTKDEETNELVKRLRPQLQHPPTNFLVVQAEEVPAQHRRRTARGYRETRQGVHRRQAQAESGRQDGRPSR